MASYKCRFLLKLHSNQSAFHDQTQPDYKPVCVINDQGHIQEEGRESQREQKQQGEGRVQSVFRQHKLRIKNSMSKRKINKATVCDLNLIQFVAQINGVDEIAFEVTEHDDLRTTRDKNHGSKVKLNTHKEHHGEQKNRRDKNRNQK